MDRKWIESIVSQAIDMCENDEIPASPANIVEELFALGYIEAAEQSVHPTVLCTCPAKPYEGELVCQACGLPISHSG